MHANNGSTIIYSTDHNKVCKRVIKTIEAATRQTGQLLDLTTVACPLMMFFSLFHACASGSTVAAAKEMVAKTIVLNAMLGKILLENF